MCKALRGNNDKPKTVEEYIAQRCRGRCTTHMSNSSTHVHRLLCYTCLCYYDNVVQSHLKRRNKNKSSIGIRKVLRKISAWSLLHSKKRGLAKCPTVWQNLFSFLSEEKKIYKHTKKSFVFFFSSDFQKIPPAVDGRGRRSACSTHHRKWFGNV